MIQLDNKWVQFTIGLCIHFVYLIILYSFDISYENLQIPIGKFQNNIWVCHDVFSYFQPAINYYTFGVFGSGLSPDHFRTIGYPGLIVFFYTQFGDSWMIALQIFQAIAFAAMYPLVTATMEILLPHSNKLIKKTVFITLMVSGIYFAGVPFILTDTLFTFFFILGFYFALLSYKKNKSRDVFLYFLSMTIAALIRPTLILLPILNVVIAYWVAKRFTYAFKPILYRAMAYSIVLLLTTNLSTFRNYLNYSFLSPSSVIGLNAFKCLTKKILYLENEKKLYADYEKEISLAQNIVVVTKLRKKIMLQTIIQHPVSFVRVLCWNSINILFSNNLISNVGRFFGVEWKKFKNSCNDFKIYQSLYVLNAIFALCYLVLWGLFFWNLLLSFHNDFETVLLLGVLLLMFIVPAILTGDGGSRLRIPFEHFLFIYAADALFRLLKPLRLGQ
jgi:hypothetical protein